MIEITELSLNKIWLENSVTDFDTFFYKYESLIAPELKC